MTDITKLKAMIIDDVATVRTVLAKNLKELGIKNIIQCDSLDDAWGKLLNEDDKGSPFDIIFCDWNMPGGDGIDLLKRLRRDEDKKFSLTKFIMVTG